jgi:hypothetical protein
MLARPVDTLGVDNSDVAKWDAADESRTRANRTTKTEIRRRKERADRLGFAPAIDYKAVCSGSCVSARVA